MAYINASLHAGDRCSAGRARATMPKSAPDNRLKLKRAGRSAPQTSRSFGMNIFFFFFEKHCLF